MTFHPSQVTSPLEDAHAGGRVKIAGADFPGFGTDQEKLAALERAMVSIYEAIDALARQIERLDREIASHGQ